MHPAPTISHNYDKHSLPYYIRRRIRWFLGDRSPFLAYLKVTKRCNLDCYYCPWHSSATDFSGERTTDFWKARIEELITLGIRIFFFEGGEPTLRKDLQDLLDHCHAHGAASILSTNGTGAMWRFRPTSFTVSIDGPEHVHDAVRGQGTFQRICHNLEKRGRNRVAAITVISPDNKNYIEPMLEQLAPLVDAFLFTFLYPYHTVRVKTLTPQETEDTKRRLLKLKKTYNILNPATHLASPTGTQKCEDWLTVAVNHEGRTEHGCFVEHVEKKNCAACELGCFQVASSFYHFNFEAWFNLHRLLLRTL